MEQKQHSPMPFAVADSVRRYLSYGWGDSIIVSLVRRRFGARISFRCIDNLRKELQCTPKCRENCVFRNF